VAVADVAVLNTYFCKEETNSPNASL